MTVLDKLTRNGSPHERTKPESVSAGEVRKSVAGTLLGVLVLFACMAAVGLWVLSQAPVIPVVGLSALLLWGCVAAVIQYAYARLQQPAPLSIQPELPSRAGRVVRNGLRHFRSRFASIWQWVILLIALALIIIGVQSSLRSPQELPQIPVDTLRLAAFTYLSMGCIVFLFGNYIKALQKRRSSPLVAPMLPLSRVVFVFCAATAGMMFIFLSTNYDVCWLGWLILGVTTVLILEPFIRVSGRFYQPKALRKTPAPVGSSSALDVIFGSGQGAKGIIKDLEELVGMKVGEVWILQFFKETIEAVLFAGLIVGWLSTCITSVPLDGQGVLLSAGRYQSPPLGPGLHLTFPWPFQQITVVQTGRIRDISLGFVKDLSKPLLWTEKHVEGEKNLLIGDGESLLTINVPILYRVSDAIAFLKTTTDAETALKDLAERKLIQIATARESFHMMTEDRAAIAETLKQGLQAEMERLGLGLEIIYVGLKDIHPPVEVAPAYQAVVSAQEQKAAMIDDARAYEARTLPLAYAQANTLTVGAQATATQRVGAATGAAARFEAMIAAEKAHPELLRLRLRYDAIDATLATPAKTIVGIPAESSPEFFLDLRTNTNASRNPAEMPRP